MKTISGSLIFALAAALASSAVAAPQAPLRPPVLSPVRPSSQTGTQPNPADYPLEVSCKPSIQLIVAAYDVPNDWSSYGLKAMYRDSEVYYSQNRKKDYMACNYVDESKPDHDLTSIWSYSEKGACIANPTKPGFLCKSGTVPTTH